ncbi:hypothetical protein AMES_5294 [Amycolatopsis mediterranei S699]|uniref:DUF1269 domain-containing protein n=2 Tax=Amycolatopsis mediterranei TaxID=33910 RepID=A0A0H3DBX2_AMYMU|nr:hypothetical protein [Amycolatopsis mediterranei]ADJ47119.1 conserved hypothetical protein [Amycolatopsis mediterranei U32]AEK43938.1 hypothetical protein RAM_27305 [Amycolatopsis mediterranei S699]AFO78830.1 hypothetical protein AMES_5294 [Amycolatopsis mediterranei S699]AGT85958.1 hypothetical protein B737_5294 [Amycolatopsis mediterranei RB]KDO04538.1 hypothetical protein DV26_43735 [Amycolatopsis mediterranei]
MTPTESVATIRFPQSGQAYQALSDLHGLSDTLTSLEVRSAALVERTPEGTLHVPEQGDAVVGTGATAGGLAGMVLGVLGGPLGVLLGFGTGALVGGVFDVDRATGVESALALLAARIPPGTTAVVVDAVEAGPEPLDQLAARYGTTVERQPAAQLTAEVEAADAAAEAARKEARRVLRERKRIEAKAKIDEKIGAVKEKLHHG